MHSSPEPAEVWAEVSRSASCILASRLATGRSIANADLPRPFIASCVITQDAETIAAVAQVPEVNVLVNSSWGGYERMTENGQFTRGLPFWEQPDHRWPSMMNAGVQAAFVASTHAARTMVPRKQGLIVNISHWAAQKHIGNTIYGISKAATDKMTSDYWRTSCDHSTSRL